MINRLPIDVLRHILLKLPPESIPNLALVNKRFSSVIKSDIYWRVKLHRHFPVVFEALEEIAKKEAVDRRATFKNVYLDKYEHLSHRHRKIVSLVKENDIEELQKLNLNFVELISITYRKDRSLIDLAHFANQAIRDYFYSIALNQFLDDDKGDFIAKLDPYGTGNILHWAIRCHQPRDVIYGLIDAGVSVNEVTDLGATPIYYAVELGHLEIFKMLLDKNDDVNIATIHAITLLHSAAYEGHLSIAQELLARRATVDIKMIGGCTPLHFAAYRGHLEIFKELIANNASIHLASEAGLTPLIMAAAGGHLKIVKALIAMKVNVDNIMIRCSTPLQAAAQNGHFEVVKELLAQKASVNKADKYGRTALFFAVQQGHYEIVKLLLRRNANLQTTNDGDTLLHIAVVNGYLNIVKELLANNAKIDIENYNGKTPLSSAQILNHIHRTDIIFALNKKRLVNYITGLSLDPTYHKRSLSLFGHKINFGYPAGVKRQAARALQQVMNGTAPEKSLDVYQGALNNGVLSTIYKCFLKFKPVTACEAPQIRVGV